jgi:membrane protease YdiL (CAAX protease family)
MNVTPTWSNVARAMFLVVLLAAWKLCLDALSAALGPSWRQPLILLGIVGLGCVVWGRSSLRELGWRFDRPLRLAWVTLLLTALESAMIYGAYAIIDGTEGMLSLTAAVASISVSARLFFLVMGILVAFVEESLFRGDLLRALQAKSGSTAAVIASSVVFGLYHLNVTPLPLAMKTAFGVMFAVAALRTGSLVPAAIAHALMWTIFANN